MAAWRGVDSPAVGWRQHPEGYVEPRELRLFRPSLLDSDYTMEFLGQIEHASLGWVVRARDRNNYYAVKVTVVKPGLRQYVAVEHFAVVGGKTTDYSLTPLTTMMHTDSPFRVTVNVKGDEIATSIAGEQVESWRAERLSTGGVGFFSGPGERARLYWVELSKNQDRLGRVCARLSGLLHCSSTSQTAMWFPTDTFVLMPEALQHASLLLPSWPRRNTESLKRSGS
jgi:hypothetical protein